MAAGLHIQPAVRLRDGAARYHVTMLGLIDRLDIAQRDASAQLLRENFDGTIDFKRPDGGLAFWITFRDSLVLDAIENGVPHGNVRFPIAPYEQRGLRLGYASGYDTFRSTSASHSG